MVCLICTVLLLRAYVRTRMRLLLWSAICFFGLTASNGLVFVDLNILPEVDLYFLRLITGAIAMLILLYGLIWEGER